MQTVDIVGQANALLAAGNRSRAIGLKIAPRMRDAIVFSNVLPDGRIDQRSIHAGLPVTPRP